MPDRDTEFDEYYKQVQATWRKAKQDGDTGRSDITDTDGNTIGTAERVTRDQAVLDVLDGEPRIRSPRPDEQQQFATAEEELAFYMSRLIC